MTSEFCNTKVAPHSIVACTPDAALSDGLWWLKVAGEVNQSRNGRVVVSPVPVVTCYPQPKQRVMFSPLRDANPFFHFFEGLWMLAGRNEAAMVANYAKQMETFADDGLLWGAYGYRWRHFFGFDQLAVLIEELKANPLTRRAVLSMWSPDGDLVPRKTIRGGDITHDGGSTSKDVPCNTQVYFDGTRGRLNMTVTNRSNDIVWGAYGANLVHMSMMHEFMAAAAGLPLGVYYQMSNNYHAYIDRPDVKKLINTESDQQAGWYIPFNPTKSYLGPTAQWTYPMLSTADWQGWLAECEEFVADPLGARPYNHDFFPQVAYPLMAAHAAHKAGDFRESLKWAKQCAANDWKVAALEWLDRREWGRLAKIGRELKK
jgi:hypothetical protein